MIVNTRVPPQKPLTRGGIPRTNGALAGILAELIHAAVPQRIAPGERARIRQSPDPGLEWPPMRKPQKRDRESIAQLLRRQGITPTHQRMEIAHVLFTKREHLAADQILKWVNSRYAETSKATVYNTLKLFLERKLIRELVVDPAKIVYDPNTEPHHHLYDVVTGRLTDVPADNIRVVGLPALPQGTVADGVDIIIRTRPQS